MKLRVGEGSQRNVLVRGNISCMMWDLIVKLA